MSCEDAVIQIQQKLARMVRAVSSDPNQWDDLYQEALIHFWRLRGRFPEQTESWYIEGCKFRVLRLLSHGRSIDAYKRRALRVLPPEQDEDGECLPADDPALAGPLEPSPLDHAAARDFVERLRRALTAEENQVLRLLESEYTRAEIGRELRLTPMVVRDRLGHIHNVAQRAFPAN
jgi:RNA polymerase sigma factor (sigma-70 family)